MPTFDKHKILVHCTRTKGSPDLATNFEKGHKLLNRYFGCLRRDFMIKVILNLNG